MREDAASTEWNQLLKESIFKSLNGKTVLTKMTWSLNKQEHINRYHDSDCKTKDTNDVLCSKIKVTNGIHSSTQQQVRA